MASYSESALAGHHYLHPVWRFGRVLQTPSGQSLPVSQALEMGELFKPGRESANRYFNSRMEKLCALATNSGANVSLSGPRQITVTYHFVPIVSFPEFTLTWGEAIWKMREGITVCGAPSKSKIWFRAALTSWRGVPTDQGRLSGADLEFARDGIDDFTRGVVDSLVEFYRGVLREDTRTLDIGDRIEIDDLSSFAEAEIVGLTVDADLDMAFDRLEELGYGAFRSHAIDTESGTSKVLDFMSWADYAPRAVPEGWRSNTPKMFDFYAFAPDEDSVRALLLPKEHAIQRSVWYGLVGERLMRSDGRGFLFTGNHAARIMAQEYGRCF